MKYTHKEIVALFDNAQEDFRNSIQAIGEANSEIRSAELLVERTLKQIENRKVKLQILSEKANHAKERIAQFTPYIGESRVLVREEARILAKITELDTALAKRRKVYKDWKELV